MFSGFPCLNTSVAFQGLSCTALRGSQTSGVSKCSLTAEGKKGRYGNFPQMFRVFLLITSKMIHFLSSYFFEQQKKEVGIYVSFTNEYTLLVSYDSWKIFVREKKIGGSTNPWINKRIELFTKKTSAAKIPNEVELFHTCVVAPDLPDLPAKETVGCWKISWAPETQSQCFFGQFKILQP